MTCEFLSTARATRSRNVDASSARASAGITLSVRAGQYGRQDFAHPVVEHQVDLALQIVQHALRELLLGGQRCRRNGRDRRPPIGIGVATGGVAGGSTVASSGKASGAGSSGDGATRRRRRPRHDLGERRHA
jgi:hypothetical protein